MTTTKHIHHDVIIEWAKGATIQYYDNKDEKWVDTLRNKPVWSEDGKYRVKPATKKCRVALLKFKSGTISTVTANSEEAEQFISCNSVFVRWLTDWIEYEV